jgi:hypothetical protein
MSQAAKNSIKAKPTGSASARPPSARASAAGSPLKKTGSSGSVVKKKPAEADAAAANGASVNSRAADTGQAGAMKRGRSMGARGKALAARRKSRVRVHRQASVPRASSVRSVASTRTKLQQRIGMDSSGPGAQAAEQMKQNV